MGIVSDAWNKLFGGKTVEYSWDHRFNVSKNRSRNFSKFSYDKLKERGNVPVFHTAGRDRNLAREAGITPGQERKITSDLEFFDYQAKSGELKDGYSRYGSGVLDEKGRVIENANLHFKYETKTRGFSSSFLLSGDVANLSGVFDERDD